MTLQVQELDGGKVLEVHISDKLQKQDYQHFTPAVEKLIAAQGKLRILMVMKDFHGWEVGALWEDIKFDVKHFRDIERLAMVGDKKWEQGMATFCKPFTSATVRYFDASQVDQARQWVQEA